MFSKSCEYGLRAVLFIAQQSDKDIKVSMTTISEEINSPQAFTAKILQKLTRTDIVKAVKGPHGGFTIEPEMMDTKLSEIVTILDGDSIYKGCALGLKQCDANSPCPLHFKFIEIRDNLQEMLETTSIKSVVNDLSLESIILKR
ncbi:RrF2 family transcriptional regulator [Cellulophaga baltica]|uniref:RrF2 family transcriptional regulator n=1 Tax=Cellulophaga baltica TaxID=76594 RepID=UPI00046F3157|nr:Rrf2 family transcriptional regulator [Cellulophaga baltica]AIY14586.1 Rrf2 family transcriptional regulator [Cellulophaga baltica NN016038]